MSRPRDPSALRRSPGLHIKLPAAEADAAKADALAAGRSLAEHVRTLLRTWREYQRQRSPGQMGRMRQP